MKFLADFFPILLFFVAYKLYGIYAATAVAIAASFVQVGWHWLQHKAVQNMHLVTLAMLVFFGGLTLILQDKTFIMWKPSVINWLFAIAFFGSQFIGERTLIERMMAGHINLAAPIWLRLNNIWVLFFVTLGALNLYVANFFFIADSALRDVTGLLEIDLSLCAEQFSAQVLMLCNEAQISEENWVSFKLFGMMGLTFLFIILQGFYLSRHIQEEPIGKDQ
ncbi:MAG: septation protein IspZ [Candidatus Polarisedimenticolaceae bacterium]|nr:septation protein IspZ [Candidatus Polarisedimenticolaceae bacterium]